MTEAENRRDTLARLSVTHCAANLHTLVQKADGLNASGCFASASRLRVEFDIQRVAPISYSAMLAWITDRFASPNAVYAMNLLNDAAYKMLSVGNQLCTAELDIKLKIAELQGYEIMLLTNPGIVELKTALSVLQGVNEFWRKSFLCLISTIDCIKYIIGAPQGTVQKLPDPELITSYCPYFKAMYLD